VRDLRAYLASGEQRAPKSKPKDDNSASDEAAAPSRKPRDRKRAHRSSRRRADDQPEAATVP